ncbi:hypothetical protein [Nitrosococcus oceani]|nr:hypothetical protein [Nitrosococcus oceani]EDZ65507.1 hypothetical protein NOC27_2187 [Nitrosococcus oceani AFC27]
MAIPYQLADFGEAHPVARHSPNRVYQVKYTGISALESACFFFLEFIG